MNLVTDLAKNSLKFTFPKRERLHSKKLIEELFNKGSYFYLYPIRLAYMESPPEQSASQAMFSVPKKRFKSAVARNRIKRQMREAYRLNKHRVGAKAYNIALIYTADKQLPSSIIHKRVGKLLDKLNTLA